VTALPLVRVRLKYVDADTFVDRFAANVTRGGIFLASRDPKPVGALVRFEIALLNGAAMMTGEGRVTWINPNNPAEPTRPHGMGVQFTQVDDATRGMLDRLLERRDAAGKRGGAPAPRAPERRPVALSGPVTTEFDTVEDTALRRAVSRARMLGGNLDDLDGLLKGEPEEPASRAQALQELPRFLATRRGSSGLFRLHPEVAPATVTPPESGAPPAEANPAPVVQPEPEAKLAPEADLPAASGAAPDAPAAVTADERTLPYAADGPAEEPAEEPRR
jgi:molecular chaperone DnaK